MVAKVDNIDPARFVFKTTYDIDKSDAEKSTKLMADVMKKHGPLATKNELNAVENKIPDT